MKRLYLPLILLLFLVLEGVALDLLPIQLVNTKTIIVPHWVLIILIFIVIFYDLEETYYSILYGIIFGLLIDIVYTNILGVYMFAYFVSIYLVFIMGRSIRVNLLGAILLGIVGLTIVDSIIYFIYYFIGVTYISLGDYAYYRLLPTVLANIVFLIMLYPLLYKRLAHWQERQLRL